MDKSEDDLNKNQREYLDTLNAQLKINQES